MRTSLRIIVGIILVIGCEPAAATVTTYVNKSAWQSSIGDHTALTFQGFPEHMIITNQFTSSGVVFSDGNDRIIYNDSLLNDGIGLRSSDFVYGTIHLDFDAPILAVAADFLGNIDIQLYADGELIYSSITFGDSQSRFGGLISTVPFDAAVIRDPSDGVVVIDDLYFGPPIPATGALGLFALASLTRRRRGR